MTIIKVLGELREDEEGINMKQHVRKLLGASTKFLLNVYSRFYVLFSMFSFIIKKLVKN